MFLLPDPQVRRGRKWGRLRSPALNLICWADALAAVGIPPATMKWETAAKPLQLPCAYWLARNSLTGEGGVNCGDQKLNREKSYTSCSGLLSVTFLTYKSELWPGPLRLIMTYSNRHHLSLNWLMVLYETCEFPQQS